MNKCNWGRRQHISIIAEKEEEEEEEDHYDERKKPTKEETDRAYHALIIVQLHQQECSDERCSKATQEEGTILVSLSIERYK